MSQPIKIYNRFDVVIVPFPFTDSSITKRRPALIISESIWKLVGIDYPV
jgi:mRNA interferase MazF